MPTEMTVAIVVLVYVAGAFWAVLASSPDTPIRRARVEILLWPLVWVGLALIALAGIYRLAWRRELTR